MGGCLSLALASQRDDIDGVISMSAPLRLMPECFIMAPYAEDQLWLHRPLAGKAGTARRQWMMMSQIRPAPEKS